KVCERDMLVNTPILEAYFTFGYKKPNASGSILIALCVQTLAQAVHPQQSALFVICIICCLFLL
ncbi:hypothetical protein, partial [Phocaeicola coprocola]|uniref:hypothetical protein n=1 Tax=Phocaeicola coprocola TaxID=310298 RepID=UPI004026428D